MARSRNGGFKTDKAQHKENRKNESEKPFVGPGLGSLPKLKKIKRKRSARDVAKSVGKFIAPPGANIVRKLFNKKK